MPLPSSKREVSQRHLFAGDPRLNTALLVWVTIILLAASAFS